MSIRAQDVVSISEARTRLTELAEEVVAGAEKVLTKNGAALVALVDAKKLDYYHELEQQDRTRVFSLADLAQGLQDAAAGRVMSEDQFRNSMQERAERIRRQTQK